MDRIPPQYDDGKRRDAALARLEATLSRLESAVVRLDRRLDDFCDVYLNSKFPYGRPADRWGRRRRGL